MKIINNTTELFGDDLKQSLDSGARLKIAASCFSIYAFEALKDELEKIEELEFVFTSPTFVPNEALDKLRKEKREFHIPKSEREKSFYGSEFEIQLKNKLTQKAIAKECADWIQRKATFKSNMLKIFMDLNLVDYQVRKSNGAKPVSDIVDETRDATVQIICKEKE